MQTLHLLILCSLILFTACGGGSSSNSDTTTLSTSTIQRGIISDSQIIGLRYISTNADKSQVKKGFTNDKGEFEYFTDGVTEFYVGNIKIAKSYPEKYVSITTLASTEEESQNIARFLQTIDEDYNPDNGIQIPANIDENANKESVSLNFGDNFESEFSILKNDLFKNSANIPETVTVAQAVEHSSKSLRLSSLKEFDLYKAIVNDKEYSSTYYNKELLQTDQKRRVYLWLWEQLLSKEMEIEDELQFTSPKYDLDNVEETRNQIQKYLDYADVVNSVASLGTSTYENISKAGTRTFAYELTSLTSLTTGGCDAAVKLYNADTNDSVSLDDDNLCLNMMKILNPNNDPADKLSIVNPILSGFLPEVLPKLLHAKQMNWLHFNTKSLRTISKLKVAKPDIASIALSIAGIANNFYGASWASNINEEITTRMVAREWLSIWFRSGFDQLYMNKLINNNTTKLIGKKEQIEAIALKLGSTGTLCDIYTFFNPFYECKGIEKINYNYDKVIDITTQYLQKSNLLYDNVVDLTGPLSDVEGEIGVVAFDYTTLYSPPKAFITLNKSSAFEDENITFDASKSSDDDGYIKSYRWYEGITLLSTEKFFSKNDFSVGNHTITLTVTDDTNLSDQVTVDLTISSLPEITDDILTITEANENLNIDLNDIKTIKCNDLLTGDTFTINNTPYVVVDDDSIKEIKNNTNDFEHICTSLVTRMGYLFNGATDFNQDISKWDVSNVTYMQGLFSETDSFNQYIGDWNVSSVTDMEYLFSRATAFNQPLSNWDLSSVTTMDGMFAYAAQFNQNINSWNVSSVTKMQGLFREASSFNQPLNNWDVSSVTTTNTMFQNATNFNQSLDNWDVSSVVNMAGMFENATSFNQPIGSWNTKEVTIMVNLFNGASNFNQPIENWDVSSVKDMRYLFNKATSFNQPLNSWIVESAQDMSYMFNEATSFNQKLDNWNVHYVTKMNYMFNGASSFSNHDLSTWNVNYVKEHTSFLDGAGPGNVEPNWKQ